MNWVIDLFKWFGERLQGPKAAPHPPINIVINNSHAINTASTAGGIAAPNQTIETPATGATQTPAPVPPPVHQSARGVDRPEEAAGPTPEELALLAHKAVARLMRNPNWEPAASAAVDYLMRGTQPIDSGWKTTGTWEQVEGTYRQIRNEAPAHSVPAVNWSALLDALKSKVTAGRVTTYGNCSQWAFQHRAGGNAIRSMLQAAARRGNHEWTNRVVFEDGRIGNADAAFGQGTQLRAEGIPFSGANVDLRSCPPVNL